MAPLSLVSLNDRPTITLPTACPCMADRLPVGVAGLAWPTGPGRRVVMVRL